VFRTRRHLSNQQRQSKSAWPPRCFHCRPASGWLPATPETDPEAAEAQGAEVQRRNRNRHRSPMAVRLTEAAPRRPSRSRHPKLPTPPPAQGAASHRSRHRSPRRRAAPIRRVVLPTRRTQPLARPLERRNSSRRRRRSVAPPPGPVSWQRKALLHPRSEHRYKNLASSHRLARRHRVGPRRLARGRQRRSRSGRRSDPRRETRSLQGPQLRGLRARRCRGDRPSGIPAQRLVSTHDRTEIRTSWPTRGNHRSTRHTRGRPRTTEPKTIPLPASTSTSYRRVNSGG
jgi:hypothetical protein